MGRLLQHISTRPGEWLLLLAVAAYGVGSFGAPGLALVPLAILIFPAMLVAYTASADRGQPVRLSATFILAATRLLPAPGCLLVGLAAVLVGRGGAVAGASGRGFGTLTRAAVAVALVQALSSLTGPLGAAGSPTALLWLTGLLVALQGASIGLAHVFGRATPRRAGWRRALLLEGVNAPLAWILSDLLAGGHALAGVALASMIVLAQLALADLSRTRAALQTSRASLAARVTELETLHAIGREILSSLDTRRVCSIIDRECRKIFPADFCFIALAPRDDRQLSIVFRRMDSAPQQTGDRLLGEGLAQSVARDKIGLRVDDFAALPEDSTLLGDLVAEGMRASITVPLIVEDRVVGVLSLQSREPDAYDDHQLSVLTTIGQQAAVAIENAKHYQMATIDSLTGFFLRDHFFTRLEEEHRRATRYGGTFALLMLDLDGFKDVNDRHGHMAGDEYLRRISATIRTQLRGADMVCRYGGDEFCLLLPETDFEGARVIAERIRLAISRESVAVSGLAVRSTASIGLAAYPEHDTGEVQDLVRKADEALYRAKRAGRDCVVPFAA